MGNVYCVNCGGPIHLWQEKNAVAALDGGPGPDYVHVFIEDCDQYEEDVNSADSDL